MYQNSAYIDSSSCAPQNVQQPTEQRSQAYRVRPGSRADFRGTCAIPRTARTTPAFTENYTLCRKPIVVETVTRDIESYQVPVTQKFKVVEFPIETRQACVQEPAPACTDQPVHLPAQNPQYNTPSNDCCM